MKHNRLIIRKPYSKKDTNEELIIEFNDSFDGFTNIFPIKLEQNYNAIYMDELPNYEDVPNNTSILENDDFRKLKKGMLLKIGNYLFSFKDF